MGKGQITYEIRRVMEYRHFFVGEEPIDISSTLKLFSRNSLISAAVILSHHYGNFSMPDGGRSFFSESSKKHIAYLNKLFSDYFGKVGVGRGQKVEMTTYRTTLELWRLIFSIRPEEFSDEVAESDFELLLFKVILTLNEKIVSFTEREQDYGLDELMFLNGFLTNDSNRYDFKAIMQPQTFYFHQLVDFIPTNDVLSRTAEKLFSDWGIDCWQQYFTTILCIAAETDKYIVNNKKGLPVITPEWIALNEKSGFLSSSLIDYLSIDEDAYLPYEEEMEEIKDLNIDYRHFRSKPFVKFKDGSGYVVINNQLLCERLFNSLFFDFSPLINGKKGSLGLFDYNKQFVEKVLFRNTFFNCIPSDNYTFPERGLEKREERPHEPDFYVRTKRGELVIVECKAIKMNGECRDDGDYARLLDELHEKIVLKTRNLDKNRKEHKGEPEPIGVGQLTNHIESIEADDFEWDEDIPNDVAYYPLLVFEDVKLVQTGILSIVNRWFYEELDKKKELVLKDCSIMPIMVISTNTLYLYDTFLVKRGICNVIDAFVKDYARYDSETGQYVVDVLADFDAYLRRNTYKKAGNAVRWLRKIMKQGNIEGVKEKKC